jgi:hypothetical protein
LNSNAYIVTERDPWQKDYILMLNVHSLSKSPKVALNSLRNILQSLSKGDWCSNKGANQTRAMLDNKVLMNPTWVGLVGYDEDEVGWSNTLG